MNKRKCFFLFLCSGVEVTIPIDKKTQMFQTGFPAITWPTDTCLQIDAIAVIRLNKQTINQVKWFPYSCLYVNNMTHKFFLSFINNKYKINQIVWQVKHHVSYLYGCATHSEKCSLRPYVPIHTFSAGQTVALHWAGQWAEWIWINTQACSAAGPRAIPDLSYWSAAPQLPIAM